MASKLEQVIKYTSKSPEHVYYFCMLQQMGFLPLLRNKKMVPGFSVPGSGWKVQQETGWSSSRRQGGAALFSHTLLCLGALLLPRGLACSWLPPGPLLTATSFESGPSRWCFGSESQKIRKFRSISCFKNLRTAAVKHGKNLMNTEERTWGIHVLILCMDMRWKECERCFSRLLDCLSIK